MGRVEAVVTTAVVVCEPVPAAISGTETYLYHDHDHGLDHNFAAGSAHPDLALAVNVSYPSYKERWWTGR